MNMSRCWIRASGLRLAVICAATALVSCSATLPPLQPAHVPSEVLNPDVRPETIDQTICVPGYTASVRPATSYTNGVKARLLRESGTAAENASKYELDHVIPLAVGGHPRNIKNLRLQAWDGEDGAKKKDRLERRLQQLVCSKLLGLRDAQAAIWTDWQVAYSRYVQTHN
jgi:hypothetical protein